MKIFVVADSNDEPEAAFSTKQLAQKFIDNQEYPKWVYEFEIDVEPPAEPEIDPIVAQYAEWKKQKTSDDILKVVETKEKE